MLPRSKSNVHIIAAVACLALTAACSKPAPEPEAKSTSTTALATVTSGTTLLADPNPITSDGSGVGETLISWSTTPARVEIRIGTPNGKLFARGGAKGTAQTGHWVGNGMMFYLQDSTAPDPTAASATLGTVAIVVK